MGTCVSLQIGGRALAAGTAVGEALVLDEPLSLWGGMDPATGRLVDRRHPQHGALLRGRVVVMPAARGSSSSSSVLAEAVRAGTAPAAVVLSEEDLILPIGAAVAQELYGARIPIVLLGEADLGRIQEGDRVTIAEDGSLQIARPGAGGGNRAERRPSV